MKFPVSNVLLLLLAAVCAANTKDDEETWFQQSIDKHKKYIERALLHVKHALTKNNPSLEHRPWTRPGARIARSCDADKSVVETRHAVQKSEVMEVPQEPHIGMVFQVFDVKQSPVADEETETEVDEEEESSMTMYELLEPVQLDLGVVPEHLFDYAYVPVAVGEDDERRSSDGGMRASHDDSVTVTWPYPDHPTMFRRHT